MFDESWTIYKVKSGSQAYGTNLPTSDLDVKGIAIPPLEYYLSFHKKFEQHESKDPDIAIYEFKKFIKLASDCNPNIIEVLNVVDEDILFMDGFGEMLRNNKEIFLSAKAKHTFTGYAHSQMIRLKNHKKWNDFPPEHPKRTDYGLPEHKSLMDHSRINAIDMQFGFNKDKNPSSDVRELIAQKFGDETATNYYLEKKYRLALRDYSNYEEWKKNRNKERHGVETKFGYDTKHAMHLIRLLRMGKEILTEGRVEVKRSDAEELKSIRAGAWDYDKLMFEAESLDELCNKIYEEKAYVVSHSPNIPQIDSLCMMILREKFNIKE